MRSAKESENFPYCMGPLCYFEVDKNGTVLQMPHKNKCDRPPLAKAYKRAANKTSALYAVWPGNWRSGLFVIDALAAFAQAFGLT